MPAPLEKNQYFKLLVPVSLYKQNDGGGNKLILDKQLPVGTIIVKPGMGGSLDSSGSGRTILWHDGGFVYEDEVMKRGNYKNLGYSPVEQPEESTNNPLKKLSDIISSGMGADKINPSQTQSKGKKMNIYKVVKPYTIGTYMNNIGVRTSAEAFAPKVGDKVEGVMVDNPMPPIGGKLEQGILLPIKFTSQGRENTFEQFIPQSSLELVTDSTTPGQTDKAVNAKAFPYKKVFYAVAIGLAIYGGYKMLN